jgi:hypothetical protein
METSIKVIKTFYNRDYDKVIDTTFSQLISSSLDDSGSATITVDDFFQLYSDLFYQIPKTGDSNSHTYLVNKSSDYLGISTTNINVLLAEITTLRQQLLDANQEINTLLQNLSSSIS